MIRRVLTFFFGPLIRRFDKWTEDQEAAVLAVIDDHGSLSFTSFKTIREESGVGGWTTSVLAGLEREGVITRKKVPSLYATRGALPLHFFRRNLAPMPTELQTTEPLA